MFFKGYILTENKQALEKFKGRTDFKTYEQVKSLPEYGGILDDDTILVDVDDYETSEKLYAIVRDLGLCCRVYKTTRGKHFLFENSGIGGCKTGCKLAIGIKADIKVGKKNSYEVLKYNGEEREILYDNAVDEKAEPLPRWLFPVKSKMEFLNMEVGDGRNQSLFTYILTLQSNGFSADEARETIRIMNKYIFTNPLSESEVEVILRDEAFQKPVFYSGSTFLFDKFAAFLKSDKHITKISSQLHCYKDGIYIPGDGEIENAMIQYIPGLNRAKRSEVLAYLDVMIRESDEAEDANYIAFENGLYNIIDDTFVEFSPKHIITNKIRWNYRKDAYSELADKTLDKLACHDPQIRSLLEEMIGYCFYRRNELGKAFILIGDKSNGKSTFLAMIQHLLGEESISSLDLKELGDRFKTAELFGKLANIGDDIGDEFIADSSIFKKLVTGDRVSAERKGKDPFEFCSYAKMLFSANNIPRIKDKTGAVQRRLVIVPFEATFSASDPDFNPYIKHLLKTEEVMQYLIVLGIRGLKRVLTNRGFTTSEKVQQALKEYEESNNPIIGFFHACEDEGYDLKNQPTNSVYQRYREYCLANSLQAMSNIEFSRQTCRMMHLQTAMRRINGARCRMFVAEEVSE